MTRTPPPDSEPLGGGVTTGQDNVIHIAPFRLLWLECATDWNVCDGKLPVSFEIDDPNGRIVKGRIRYYVQKPHTGGLIPPIPLKAGDPFDATPRGLRQEELEPVHETILGAEHLTSGVHELPEGECWDGKATVGRYAGDFVAPDRTPVTVVLELWNTAAADPGAMDDDGAGQTDRNGEFLARARVTAHLGYVKSAEWTTNWCVPYDDPDDKAYGWTRMDIKLCGIPDGTRVRLMVVRLGDPMEDAPTHRVYAVSDQKPDDQPALQGLTVKGGKVRNDEGKMPFVNFNEYDEHWKYDGNNFYGFYIAFGDHGDWMPAGETDWRENEKQCCHMRFTVYMHCGDTNSQRQAAVNRLHGIFRQKTKYFRSYKATSPYSNYKLIHRRLRHRYLCVFIGHGYTDCWHPDHPRRDSGRPKDHTHTGFKPDRFVCPKELRDDAAEIMKQEEKDYGIEIIAGCGHRSHYRNMPILGAGNMLWNNFAEAPDSDNAVQIGEAEKIATDPATKAISLVAGEFPRFFFWAGGCRTITVDKLAECFNAHGTRYYHGWQYSVDRSHNIGLMEKVITEWIKVRGVDAGEDEWDQDRFLAVYNDFASQTEYGSDEHPSLRSSSGIIAPRANPAGASEGMR